MYRPIKISWLFPDLKHFSQIILIKQGVKKTNNNNKKQTKNITFTAPLFQAINVTITKLFYILENICNQLSKQKTSWNLLEKWLSSCFVNKMTIFKFAHGQAAFWRQNLSTLITFKSMGSRCPFNSISPGRSEGWRCFVYQSTNSHILCPTLR